MPSLPEQPKMQAGKLRDRITFARRSSAADEYGNVEGDFADQFTVWAQVQYLRGGEEVMASRLQGKQPVVITIRASIEAEQIQPEWRATGADGRAYNVRSVSESERRDHVDILCEAGVAA